jgi:transposase
MTPFDLSFRERRVLEDLTVRTDEAKSLRRAQALLWLDDGDSVQEVAERLLVTRQAVYKWVSHFQAHDGLPIVARVAEGQHTGRPRTVHGIIDPLIDDIVDSDPRDLSYRATVWTAPLLKQYLLDTYGLDVSRPSVSLALDRLRIRWKRPRHSLSRRPETWRQAKGGSGGAWRAASARSS